MAVAVGAGLLLGAILFGSKCSHSLIPHKKYVSTYEDRRSSMSLYNTYDGTFPLPDTNSYNVIIYKCVSCGEKFDFWEVI